MEASGAGSEQNKTLRFWRERMLIEMMYDLKLGWLNWKYQL